MSPVGVDIAISPESTLIGLVFVACGITLGAISGLTPGIHANTFALLLAALAPSIPGPGRYLAAMILAAGVVATFLDVVPALALGVPDPAMAPTALPGHSLVLRGRGREALRLSALGSALAVTFAVPLAVPITEGMVAAYPAIDSHLSLILGTVAVLLVLTEHDTTSMVGAALSVAASGTLGIVALDAATGGVFDVGGTLMPLFSGLFGAPVLIDALGGEGVPPQEGPEITISLRFVLSVALVGTVAGAIVGYIPGISSAIAATAALLLVPSRGSRGFIIASSGVNTANAIFALFALLALGSPRSGILVAIEAANLPLDLPLLVASIAISAAVGFVLVVSVGDRYLATVGRLDSTRLSVAILGLLAFLVVLLSGFTGLAIFGASVVVGSIPARFGTRRATLMGVLLVPLAV